jgi:uncharacterized membrane protein YdjX (TVP38/TMEM64 family)
VYAVIHVTPKHPNIQLSPNLPLTAHPSAGYVPELDDDGNPKQSDSKLAITVTAFAVAAGAVALRIGGRAALVSAVGLDFANDNPQLKEQLDNILNAAASMDPTTEAVLFVLAWTACKVFLFDAGGVALALSAGLLFGGVFQGALLSAFAATVGSSVCFVLAKLDTPVRQKAIEALEQNPSLRGIEKVVARDGFKAILVLRLAPILPVPLGLYNYIYAVTGVPFFDFAAGIFLGSLKPYLLDSYLGYFGKTVIDGSAAADPNNAQDVILLLAIGLSVLIGVFASQLAGETWDTVLKELEAEEREQNQGNDDIQQDEGDDGIVRNFFGVDLPIWLVGFQLQLAMANERVNEMVDAEFDAKVWNYTKTEPIPRTLDPAKAPDSPEIVLANTGFDFGASAWDGLVLSPILSAVFWKYANPLLNEEEERTQRPNRRKFRDRLEKQDGVDAIQIVTTEKQDGVDAIQRVTTGSMVIKESEPAKQHDMTAQLMDRVGDLKAQTQAQLDRLEEILKREDDER